MWVFVPYKTIIERCLEAEELLPKTKFPIHAAFIKKNCILAHHLQATAKYSLKPFTDAIAF